VVCGDTEYWVFGGDTVVAPPSQRQRVESTLESQPSGHMKEKKKKNTAIMSAKFQEFFLRALRREGLESVRGGVRGGLE